MVDLFQCKFVNVGGPLVVMGWNAAQLWSGIDPYTVIPAVPPNESYSPCGEPTDYDRACDVLDWAELIPFATENVLVLHNELYTAGWANVEHSKHLLLGRTVTWDDEDIPHMLQMLPDVSVDDWESVGLLGVESWSLVLMHGSEPRREGKVIPPEVNQAGIGDIITRDVVPGVFEVRTREISFPNGGHYVWHSLTRLP